LPISKEAKNRQVEKLSALLGESNAVVVLDYRGLSAAQMAQLRSQLRPVQGRLVVAKNSLIRRSLRELGMPIADNLLTGPSAFNFCLGDLAGPVSAIAGFARDNDALSIKGAIVDGSVLDAAAATDLKDIPTPEVLRSQVVGGLQAPFASLVDVVNRALQELAFVVNARVEQMETAG
jgi:large subunit ribosomal protein L10